MFHETGQRHVVRGRQLAYRQLAAAQRLEDASARRVGECGEHCVELRVLILNHMV